jgi:chemotaxis protein MotA
LFVIIGCVVVFVAVVGGYLFAHGNLHVLFQPAEVIIIFGAATGALLISSPPPVFRAVVKTFPKIFSYKGFAKQDYVDLMVLLFKLFQKMRKEGLISVEEEIDNPEKSKIFSAHPQVLKNHHAINFICDSIRIVITSNMPGTNWRTFWKGILKLFIMSCFYQLTLFPALLILSQDLE